MLMHLFFYFIDSSYLCQTKTTSETDEKEDKKNSHRRIGNPVLYRRSLCRNILLLYILPTISSPKTTYIYIDKDDTIDSIYNKVKIQGHPKSFTGFLWMTRWRNYDSTIHTGRYAIRPGENVYHVFSRLYRGYQEPYQSYVSATYAL